MVSTNTMKIAILGSPNTIESLWMEEEATKRGHTIERFSIKDIVFSCKGGKFTVVSKYDLASFDIFLMRGMYLGFKIKGHYFNTATEYLLLLKYIHEVLKKPIVDEVLVTRPQILNKMSTALDLSRANLPQPETHQYNTKEEVLRKIKCFTYPMIVKDPGGRKGINIFKIDTKSELRQFLRRVPDQMPYLFQEYLKTDGDIRVFVVGFKAIGAMKRFVISGDFRANISQGAHAEKFPITKEVSDIAERAAKATGIEVAGVDLIESEGKFYVIEVNRAPQFKGFRKFTGGDPSPFIIDYLEQKAK